MCWTWKLCKDRRLRVSKCEVIGSHWFFGDNIPGENSHWWLWIEFCNSWNHERYRRYQKCKMCIYLLLPGSVPVDRNIIIPLSAVLAVGLSRIARGEVVSFCVPAVFWWLLYTFIIFGNSSCIIFAVVRSTLLLLHFHLQSLFFRSYLVSLQYLDDFCSYAALVHVSFLLLCAVLCCFWAFICILCAFVISPCAHSILMFFFISSNNSCSIFALCVVLCWFCTCVCACCFFRTYLVSLPYFDGFYHIRQ